MLGAFGGTSARIVVSTDAAGFKIGTALGKALHASLLLVVGMAVIVGLVLESLTGTRRILAVFARLTAFLLCFRSDRFLLISMELSKRGAGCPPVFGL